MNTYSSEQSRFVTAFSKLPNIYIPFLFSNIGEKQLRNIFEQLKLFIVEEINFNKKTTTSGIEGNSAFVIVKEWYGNKNACDVRSMLQANKEVKIVFDEPWYFICKRKHELQNTIEESTPQAPLSSYCESYIDFNHIAPVPTIQKTKVCQENNSDSEESFHCPECEGDEIIENQLGHTCVQREMERW